MHHDKEKGKEEENYFSPSWFIRDQGYLLSSPCSKGYVHILLQDTDVLACNKMCV